MSKVTSRPTSLTKSYTNCEVVSVESSTDATIDNDYASLNCDKEWDRTLDVRILTPGQHNTLLSALASGKRVAAWVEADSTAAYKDKFQLKKVILSK